MQNDTENLNPEQKRAVLTTEGPLLIQAGAGSGKTKTLTHRIAHILETGKATPYEILAVTFTNKAAKEMRQRVAELLATSGEDRMFMPYMGTFHGICVRLLRQDGSYVGVPDNFVIVDESDRQSLIKKFSKQLMIDGKEHPARAIGGIISSAKNELISPDEYTAIAQGPTQGIAAKIYPLYQKELKNHASLDFDDLIGKMVQLLENYPDVRKKWQARFKYILIDEYQDTNAAQYKLIKYLTNENQNICVVGDDWQCLPKGSLVTTKTGDKKIETIKTDDYVKSASGYGGTGYFKVTATRHYTKKDKTVRIVTSGGKELVCTPSHVLFARWGVVSGFFVYLMYSNEQGFRIGITKGTRFDGKKHGTGLRVRANQERADKIWVLKVCNDRQDAIYTESLFSYRYGIPMMIFRSSGSGVSQLSQKSIDALYKNINTVERSKKVFKDFNLDFEYPHFYPQATTRGKQKRININVVLFGDKRKTINSPWSASRISANTTQKDDLKVFKELGYTVRKSKNGTFRTEIHNLDYSEIERVIEKTAISSNSGAQICKYAYMTDDKFLFMPASQIHPGMVLPVCDGSNVVDERVVSVQYQQYDGDVYDIDVDKIHNYIASGIVVHNSIYSWRGADFTNILNFERDYKNATVIKLEQNYRSTKPILDAAHSVISRNKNKSEKKLWTADTSSHPVQIIDAFNERAEAESILRRIQTQIESGTRKASDFAILYRTNAQSRSIEEQFIHFRMPYKIVGGKRFYDRAEIKDIVAYLRLLYQPEDITSFDRIVNLPTRGIGKTSLEKFAQWRNEQGLTLQNALATVQGAPLPPKARIAIVEFNSIITALRAEAESAPVAITIENLLKRIKYYKYLDDGSVQGETKTENVNELLSVAKAYSDDGLSNFLEEVALVSELDSLNKDTDAVTLMTLHAAKGLEFPVVFMSGMENSIFPHARAFNDASEMEEERRLCYVGMTRAKKELYLTYADTRVLYGNVQNNAPSSFLQDVNAEYAKPVNGFSAPISNSDEVQAGVLSDEPRYVPDLEPGDLVRHQIFGKGTVSEVSGDVAAIYFKGRGVKKLNVSFAPIEKIG